MLGERQVREESPDLRPDCAPGYSGGSQASVSRFMKIQAWGWMVSKTLSNIRNTLKALNVSTLCFCSQTFFLPFNQKM